MWPSDQVQGHLGKSFGETSLGCLRVLGPQAGLFNCQTMEPKEFPKDIGRGKAEAGVGVQQIKGMGVFSEAINMNEWTKNERIEKSLGLEMNRLRNQGLVGTVRHDAGFNSVRLEGSSQPALPFSS